ncbi:CDP-paratose 2-epimerase [Aquitalea magnusonii]|nr:CDP-paratose 2-epimerase [Aquitalea magnusonii]
MKILITGGCGFLGSNLASHALEQGLELCVFDNLQRYGSQNNLAWLQKKGNLKFIHGDIRNTNDVEQTVRQVKPDVIFHLAGQVAMTTSIANPRMDFETNTLGTLNVLEAVRKYADNATIIYSSTNKVYGDLEQYSYVENETRYNCIEYPHGFDETVPLDFHSPYGCSKGAADQYLLDYNRIYGIKTIVFRHSSMYGGRQFATEDQGWIGWFCAMAAQTAAGLRREPFTISGNGKQVRDVLHAEDIISLYFSAIPNIEKIAGQAFNIGGGISNSLSLLELFSLLEKEINQQLQYTKLPPRESDQRIFVANISKITSATGWTPKITTPNGISRMLDWAKSII